MNSWGNHIWLVVIEGNKSEAPLKKINNGLLFLILLLVGGQSALYMVKRDSGCFAIY